MPDHDPIEQLRRLGADLGADLGGGDMPLSAADVRRRGDRLRRRRTALVAGGAALAVAAVVPVVALIGDGGPRADRDRTAVDEPVLAESDLLRDADTAYSPNERTPWQAVETFAGDGQAAIHPCQRQRLSSLGAESSLSRFFDWSGTEPTPGTGLSETIAEFETVDAARTAYETLTDWIVECDGHVPDADEVSVFPRKGAVDGLPGGTEAVIFDLHWGPVPEEIDPYGDDSFINETGLVLQGDRIAVLALTIVGQDYNWLDEEGGTPVLRMLPTAARRLLPGTTPDDATSVRPTETAGAGETAIPDDFPLGDGWPYGTEADGEGLVGPARDLDVATFDACGTTLDDSRHEDRLMARWQSVEYRTRQLTTYATADEAKAAISAIAGLYRDCPTDEEREDGSTPRWEVRDPGLGDESYAVLGWDERDGVAGTFGNTMVLVRVGNAVLLTAWSGHAGNPVAGGDEAVEAISDEADPVIDAMCVFAETGC